MPNVKYEAPHPPRLDGTGTAGLPGHVAVKVQMTHPPLTRVGKGGLEIYF